MKILITGICGFVGGSLANFFTKNIPGVEIFGVDNLIRPGSESNRDGLRKIGVHFFYGDIRNPSDLQNIPKVDWVIDTAANASVLAGVDGKSSSQQLIEHNLIGTINLLELCKRQSSGFILLSTSRVYSINSLSKIDVHVEDGAYVPLVDSTMHGLSNLGIGESFTTQAPVSLYGAAKLSSEVLALEYSYAYDFPVWINRCGILAGAGQFGTPDQGIFSYWINAWLRKRPLRYIGFDGLGYQVRDVLHPDDLGRLLLQQLEGKNSAFRLLNIGGGVSNAISLRNLSKWCEQKLGNHEVSQDKKDRPFDIPWMVMDSSLASTLWDWKPTIQLNQILEEIMIHAKDHPNWLDLSGVR
jgi:CDP-paratose 2-epimerase